MRQVLNWVGGGFFRTIGRTLAFLALGVLAYYLFSKSSFDIKDLFFEKVNASTITTEVVKKETTIITQDDNLSSWTDEWGKYSMVITNANGITYYPIMFVQDTGILEGHDYAEISISISQPTDATTTWQAQDDFVSCRTFTCDSYNVNTNVCSQWKCLTWYTSGTNTTQNGVVHNTSITQFNFFYTALLNDNTTTNCSVQNNTLVCPLNKKKLKALRLYVNFPTSYSTSTKFILDRNLSYYDISDTVGAINAQTEQQQQQHNETMTYFQDTNSTETDETATGFFDDFEDSDHGGLSSIITAPLVVIEEMLNGVCVQPSATWKGATISLPCGDLLWSRNGASDLKNLLNIFYGGVICYYAIRKLFMMIEGLKDPTQDRIEVIDL